MPELNTILIADDNDDDVSFILQGFADIGIPVTPTRVRDGDATLQLIEGGRKFRLIVLDYHLPKRNGVEVMRLLRSRRMMQPVVVISSHISAEQHRELQEAGVRAVLQKPTDLAGFAQLASKLANLISISNTAGGE